MNTLQSIQHAADATPSWANWLIIGGSAAASWLAPVASLIAIVWGCLQIYSWFKKHK
jgi:heme exporter protein D